MSKRIDGTRLAYNHELNAELTYQLCAAFVRAGLARAEDWKGCGEDALTFAKHSVLQAIGVERRELLERNVDYCLEIRDAYPEGYVFSQGPRFDHSLALSICCGGAGVDCGVI